MSTPTPQTDFSNKHCAFVADSRDREVWLGAREAYVGASEVYALFSGMDMPGWGKSEIELYSEKVFGSQSEPMKPGDPRQWGLDMEPTILMSVLRELNAPGAIHGRMYQSLNSRLACTIDGEVQLNGETIPVEIKNSRYTWDEDGLPWYYELQIQAQLEVVRAPRLLWAASLAGRPPAWAIVERDPQVGLEIRTLVDIFWERVNRGVPPTPDDTASAARAIKRLYPKEVKGLHIPAPERVYEIDQERAPLAEERSALDKQIKALDNELKAIIGDAERVVMQDGQGWSLKTVNQPARPAVSYRNLRRFKKLP